MLLHWKPGQYHSSYCRSQRARFSDVPVDLPAVEGSFCTSEICLDTDLEQ